MNKIIWLKQYYDTSPVGRVFMTGLCVALYFVVGYRIGLLMAAL